MTDYSQQGEQEHILRSLGFSDDLIKFGDLSTIKLSKERPGRLLDIGAWNAKTFSNSRALIELGWSAVLFEPSPGPLQGLVKEYGDNPRIEVVGLPVTVNGGLMKLRCTDDALTADAENAEHLKKWDGYGFYGTMTTFAVSLFEIHKWWGGNFDFVSIDTEGTSVELLKGLVQDTRMKPRCIVVEHDGRFEEVKEIAKASYRPVFHNGINIVLERI